MIGVRVSSEVRDAVRVWADRQADKPTLSEAIRRLIQIALDK
jgi:hypothetical protein